MKKRGRKDDGDTESQTAASAPMESSPSGTARHPPDGGARYCTLVPAGRIGGDFRMMAWMRYPTQRGWTLIGTVVVVILFGVISWG